MAGLADAGYPGAALRLARLVNALMATLAVLATAAIAARLAPGRPRAPVIAAAVAGLIPAYGFVAGFAYNDGLALAAAAGLLAAALAVHQDGARRAGWCWSGCSRRSPRWPGRRRCRRWRPRPSCRDRARAAT